MTRHPTRSTIYILFVCTLCWGFAYFSLHLLHWRGWGLNIVLPLVLAAGSTVLHGYPHDMRGKSLRDTSWLTLLVYTVGLLLFRLETLPWLLMATPLLALFSYLGFLLGLCYLRSRLRSELSMSLILLFISVPALIALESIYKMPRTRTVTSMVEIAAPRDIVQQTLTNDRSLLADAPAVVSRDDQAILTSTPGYLFAQNSALHVVATRYGKTIVSSTSAYQQRTAPALYWNCVADQALRLYQYFQMQEIREKLETK